MSSPARNRNRTRPTAIPSIPSLVLFVLGAVVSVPMLLWGVSWILSSIGMGVVTPDVQGPEGITVGVVLILTGLSTMAWFWGFSIMVAAAGWSR